MTIFSQNINVDFGKAIKISIWKCEKNGKQCVGEGEVFGALLRDHELLTAKLNAYSFNLPVLRQIHDYLSNRQLKLRSNIAMV